MTQGPRLALAVDPHHAPQLDLRPVHQGIDIYIYKIIQRYIIFIFIFPYLLSFSLPQRLSTRAQLGLKEVGTLPDGLPEPSWVHALNWYLTIQACRVCVSCRLCRVCVYCRVPCMTLALHCRDNIKTAFPAAATVSLLGFIESISVAKQFAGLSKFHSFLLFHHCLG
jgi:hypothetical protein